MIVCITEKPSVAADIARILGANVRRQGFYEGNNYCVTWTFGHLCRLKEPGEYIDRWKSWNITQLPMIPPRFGIKLIDDEGIKRQFKVIETLTAAAEEVINCGDAGQEGELIQRWVMQKASVKCPVKRLWISSMTDKAITDGFASLKPQVQYDNLYLAGLTRAICDWLLGMNATRLYSIKYGARGNILSIGRVQTPTLAMIVKRHHEIENFVPVDMFEVHTLYRNVDFYNSEKFDNQDAAQAVVDKIKSEHLYILDITKKSSKEAPPRLFDLTSLQVETNRKWGWTAENTLKLIQSLYEKKVTTYPRVDTTYLPDDIYPKIPEILSRMTPYADKIAPILAAKKIPKSKKVFDSSKVTDHHAIIPTGEHPGHLVGDEKLLYHLIALRFIAAFYPDCEAWLTTVSAKAGNTPFKASGKEISNPGWRALYGKTIDTEENDVQALPEFVKGESGPHAPKVVKKTSQPPKLFTEGTLLRAMETAGKAVDDEELREALKENGIGRPSTRAAIIETLFRRKYIERKRKSIIPTQAGIDLIATIKEDLIKSPSLTGIWEKRLRQIAAGEYSPAEFIDAQKKMLYKIINDVLCDRSDTRIITKADTPEKKPKKAAKPQ